MAEGNSPTSVLLIQEETCRGNNYSVMTACTCLLIGETWWATFKLIVESSHSNVICDKLVGSSDHLKDHILKRHGEGNLPNGSSKSQPGYSLRLGRSNPSEYFCPMCKLQFRNENERRRHVDEFHVFDARNICRLCDKNFNTVQKLREHVGDVHRRSQMNSYGSNMHVSSSQSSWKTKSNRSRNQNLNQLTRGGEKIYDKHRVNILCHIISSCFYFYAWNYK